MDESIPVLPHLPAVETWRESTQLAALHRSPRLEVLDDALEAYETSFRRYSAISQAYYMKLGARYEETGLPLAAQCVAVRELAESAYSRAVHDFEAVEIAFDAWIYNGAVSLAVPLARQMADLLSEGRSRLDLQSAPSRASPPREPPATESSARPARGPKLSLKPNRKGRSR